MEDKIINSWKGWRLEFEQIYGSDCDGATEYETYSTFDWTMDLADIIRENMMGWLTGKHSHREYSKTYLVEVSVNKLKVHFTTGYEITLSKESPEYVSRYCFGRSDYEDIIRLLPPGTKAAEISRYNEVHCRYKCLVNLKPKDVVAPEVIHAVDLGLSVDWAPFNLGAISPDELGDKFAWSEIVPEKEGYAYIRGLQDENGKPMYNERGNSLYEYSGMKKYDAATVFWGDGWRTPDKNEIFELVYSCGWTWENVSGRNGYRVTGKNGNSIFLPINEKAVNWEGRSGSSYWSASGFMQPGGSTKGETLHISEYKEGDHYNCHISDSPTDWTLYIRPVKDK